MSSDSVGGTGAANSNQPRGGPQRHGESETERKGEPDRDREGKWEKETEVQSKKKKKSRGKNSETEREGVREEQHSGYGFHHSEGCWLGVGEWEASSPVWR